MKHHTKKTPCRVPLCVAVAILTLAGHAHAVTNPYDQVALVTNTIAWPYNSSTYGTDSFQLGSLASHNADTVLLNSVKQHGLAFPSDFGFGVACSAYQYEGNRVAPSNQNPDGIGWSIWDVFSEKGSWLNPNGTNISEIAPTSLVTQPNGADAIRGFDPAFYAGDVALVKNLGVQYYRLSISWPRLYPRPFMTAPDPTAVAYYQTILKKFQQAHIRVLVTLYHWDMPAWLYNFGDPKVTATKDKTYGWLDMRPAKNNLTLKEFQKYVAASYQAFGAYTPYFSTFNEPLTFTNIAFLTGTHAPGTHGFQQLSALNPSLYGSNMTENLERIPYLQAINIIKAHYIAYKTIHALYTQNPSAYHREQPMVTMVLNSDWAEPYRIIRTQGTLHYHPSDVAAAKLNMNFMLGWWLDPIMFGHWPKSMNFIYQDRIQSVGLNKGDNSCLNETGAPVSCRAPATQRLTDYIAQGGALDAITLNHYTGYFVSDLAYAQAGHVPRDQYNTDPTQLSAWNKDQNNYPTQFRAKLYGNQGPTAGKDRSFVIGDSGNRPWLRQTWFVYRKLLQYVNYYYLQQNGYTKSGVSFRNLAIYLTENGTSIYHESQTDGQAPDSNRIQYLLGNLAAVEAAVTQDHIPVKLYTYWSIADNFEWAEGYDSRFGLVWVDYANNFQRKPKYSYTCYQQIIQHPHSAALPAACHYGLAP